jgi:hypothetical protein
MRCVTVKACSLRYIYLREQHINVVILKFWEYLYQWFVTQERSQNMYVCYGIYTIANCIKYPAIEITRLVNLGDDRAQLYTE